MRRVFGYIQYMDIGHQPTYAGVPAGVFLDNGGHCRGLKPAHPPYYSGSWRRRHIRRGCIFYRADALTGDIVARTRRGCVIHGDPVTLSDPMRYALCTAQIAGQ